MKWTTLHKQNVFEAPYIKVSKSVCEIPAKGKIAFFTVEIPDWVTAVAFAKNRLVLVKQYRYPLGKEMIELPAGFIKRGEKPRAAIQREFSEEIGFELVQIQKLGEWATMSGKGTNKMTAFVGQVGSKTKKALEKEEKGLSVLYKTPQQVLAMIKKGKIWSVPYIAAILATKEKYPMRF